MTWLHARTRKLGKEGTLQIMYGIEGAHHLPEQNLDHLEGLPWFAAGSGGKRRPQPTAVGYLWGVDGFRLPVQQVRKPDLL